MSGLPSGYTQLEYIESNGTQYIDTGFKPNQDTTVVCEVSSYGLSKENQAAFGARTANAGNDRYTFVISSSSKSYRSGFGGTNADFPTDFDVSGLLTINKTKNKTTLNGEVSVTNTSSAFQTPYPIFLFCINTAGSASALSSIKIHACKIYDNGGLVRDFVPCKNASGAVGLYDLVGAKFYANAGSGTFTAGPEIIYEPATPTNFTASVSGQTVALSWAAAANAAGYRLKRDGVQIADQTGTAYTDTVSDGTALCTYTLTAYNDAGESAAVTLLVLVHLELITDRTRADVENQTDKGFYNASDLNRVGAAVEYIAGRFTSLGYACPVTVKKNWLTSDAPTASQMDAYRQNIVTLRGQIAVMQSTPEIPASMAGLNYVKANNIEQILADMDFILQNMPAAFRHCGVTVCGSKGVIA